MLRGEGGELWEEVRMAWNGPDWGRLPRAQGMGMGVVGVTESCSRRRKHRAAWVHGVQGVGALTWGTVQ